MGHPVRFHGERQLDMGGGQVDEVVGSVRRCRSIDLGPEPLERLEKVARIVLRALEHQVLEQVGEPALVPLLVFGTDVIPKIHSHDRQLRLTAEDDVEAVGERVF